MADLSHWDFAESFTADEAANLILGFDGLDRMAASREKCVPVIIRMSESYRAAHSTFCTLIYRKSSAALAEGHKGLVSNELQNQFDFEHVFSVEGGDTKSFDNWLGGEYGRFVKQTFSRKELARWLKAIGLKSVYQFDRVGKADEMPAAIEPSQNNGKAELEGKSKTAHLNIIGAMLEMLLTKKRDFGNEAAVITEMLDKHLGKSGISERNLRRVFPAAKNSLDNS